MAAKKHIKPGDKVGIKLTATQRKLLLTGLTCLPTDYEKVIENTPADKPILLSLDDWDDLAGYVAAESNHCEDRKKQRQLDTIYDKIQNLLDSVTDEGPPKTLRLDDARKTLSISEGAAKIAEWAGSALARAHHYGIKDKPIPDLSLTTAQLGVLLLVPGISQPLKFKLAEKTSVYTIAEVAGMVLALAEDMPEGDTEKQFSSLLVATHLMNYLEQATGEAGKVEEEKTAPSDQLVSLKITLLNITPPIWRRIQTKDCTLGDLHDILQVVMGWTGKHLHRFIINGEYYGEPTPEDELEEEEEYWLSQFLPEGGEETMFVYEYDFGDRWQHEVLFEGFSTPKPKTKYPLCVEGERACPPEDCGGPWGYPELLEALADPKHEQHKELRDWVGDFDPEAFDAGKVTKEMRRMK